MKSKYVDTPAIVQVLGNLYRDNALLDNDTLHFSEEDFQDDFHKVIFASIFNLHELGAKEITIETIEDYLSSKQKMYGVYQANNGAKFLQKLEEQTQTSTFPYYYNRMKKMTLLRMYNKIGMDLSWLYDADNILNVKKKQEQDEWLDSTTLEDIAEQIDRRIEKIKLEYTYHREDSFSQAGTGAKELIADLKANPEFGAPLYDSITNTVVRGARLKKVYMRSAATGVGKTRTMIADVCTLACVQLYDPVHKIWNENKLASPAMFISTEQEVSEIQTMMLAFIADVEEEHILLGEYKDDEEERVNMAADILDASELYIVELPDFSLQDVENTIKFGIREYDITYCCFDYIHTSMKILSEISSKAKVQGLREDNILFMIGVRLKDLANQYGVFILTATQLNGTYQSSDTPDQNLLRGAKSLGDKIDAGLILMNVTQEDLEMLKPLLDKGLEVPDTKISVYKNRRGKYTGVYIWAKSRKGVCKIDGLFVTSWMYEYKEVAGTKVMASAF